MSSIDTVKNTDNMNAEELRGSKERVSQFSYIKTAACFAIVLLHCYNSARVYHAETLTDGHDCICGMRFPDVGCAVFFDGHGSPAPGQES